MLDAKTDATANGMPETNTPTAVTLPKPAETANNSSAQNETATTEQRSAEKSENAAGGSSEANASSSAKQGVSKEALEGPQGPPPHPASEFEDEAKDKRHAAKETKPS